MTNQNEPLFKRWRRRQYVVDRSMQMGVAGQLLAGIGGVALLCAAATYVFLGGHSAPGIDPLRQFMVLANATYFVLAAGILVILVILVTHRFAGPAMVMKRAIDGMLEGDYGQRLKTRDKDYLKPLSDAADALRDAWVRYDEDARRILDELEEALENGNTEEATRLVTRMRDDLLVKPAKCPPRQTDRAAVTDREEALTTS